MKLIQEPIKFGLTDSVILEVEVDFVGQNRKLGAALLNSGLKTGFVERLEGLYESASVLKLLLNCRMTGLDPCGWKTTV